MVDLGVGEEKVEREGCMCLRSVEEDVGGGGGAEESVYFLAELGGEVEEAEGLRH